MQYGEYKTEVSARYAGVDHDYYRYEIATRWFPGVDGVEWETEITSIDREGNRSKASDIIWECWRQYLSERVFMTSDRLNHRNARKDHDYAVMLVAG